MKLDSRIRVFIRARPLFKTESSDSFSYSTSTLSLKSPGPKNQNSFTFDRVYNPSSTTEEIFESSSKHIIENALAGYNGTIFAYGQTTSGKTHTMIGNMDGIIPKSLSYLYHLMQKNDNIEYKVWISYLEIYNETVNDLLEPRSINLRIREDPSEGYFVAGLKQISVHNTLEALKVLEFGEKQRSYRATNIHEHSSRSHSVLRILIESKEIQRLDMDEEEHLHLKGTVKFSVINLVDLAGSERMNEVGGDSTETSHINKSLFVLTNVINKLSESPTGHIPYRDSKLTRVLSNSIGGNALTSIICTIAPDISNIQLSLSTLRFALRAKCIRNQPKINEVLDDSALLVAYKNKISQLEAQLMNLQMSKDEEIQRLKHQLQYSIKEESEEKVLEFVNINDLGYVQKYKELQRNYKIQIDQKNSLISEITDLKKYGLLGFDMQRNRIESQKDCSKLEKWDEECSKLRNLYLMEIAGIDERYYSLMENLFNTLSNPNARKYSIPKPPANSTARPKTGQNSQNMVPDNYRIRKPYTNSSRARSKPLAPQNKVGAMANRELEKSPSPFMLVCEDVSTPNIEHEETSMNSPPARNLTQDSFHKREESVTESSLIYNPPPFMKPPNSSENALEIELNDNSNVLLFGYNKDGCCGGVKHMSDPIFYNVGQEFKE